MGNKMKSITTMIHELTVMQRRLGRLAEKATTANKREFKALNAAYTNLFDAISHLEQIA